MKIRLTGTEKEVSVTAAVLQRALSGLAKPATYQVREVSDFYRNRGSTELGRVYIEVHVELAEGAAGQG
jgi:hypothetical protein